jgi:hypothetical protein
MNINCFVLAMEVTVFPATFELSPVDYALEFPATNVQQDRQYTGKVKTMETL